MLVLVAVSVRGYLLVVAGMLLMIPPASVFYLLARFLSTMSLMPIWIYRAKRQDHPPELSSKFRENRKKKKEKWTIKFRGWKFRKASGKGKEK